MSEATTVFQPQVKAGGIAQRGNGRRHYGEDHGVGQAKQQILHGLAGDRLGRVFGTLAQRKVLERHKGNSRIEAVAVKAEVLYGNDVLDLGLLLEISFHLLDDFYRAVCSRSAWQLNIGNDVALVFLWEK